MSPTTTATTSSLHTAKSSRPASLRLDSFSPEPTIRDVDYASDVDLDPTDSGSASDSTLDDLDAIFPQYEFGYPLQRMPVIPRRSSYGVAAHGDSASEDTDEAYYSEYSESECSTSSSIIYDIDFEAVVDDLLSEEPPHFPTSRKFIMVEPSIPSAHDAFMIRPLPKRPSSPSDELDILLSLNEHEARLDPWNPVPHILSVVERSRHAGEEYVYVCLEWLSKYDEPPFKTVANYIDFIRQTLEGLTFLHENRVTCLNYGNTHSFMVDIGQRNAWIISASPTPALEPPSSTTEASASPPTPTQTMSPKPAGSRPNTLFSNGNDNVPPTFDRTRYPVRYYYTDFVNAKIYERYNPVHKDMYRKDVRECGRMIEGLLGQVPLVAPKMKALVNAMTSGTFGADDARKLFEALCKSLEASVFETPVVPRQGQDRSYEAINGGS